MKTMAFFHLPGLFEHFEFYRVFLKLFFEHRDYFYDFAQIGSIYGSPQDCLWGGGRVELGDMGAEEVLELTKRYGISARLTFSNSLLKAEHLKDKRCNALAALFSKEQGGAILHSDLLLSYLRESYPELYFVSSTTKVLTDFDDLLFELNRPEFSYVVPDFRLNKCFDRLSKLSPEQKHKVEFLCNECCDIGCMDRRACYEAVSRKNLGLPGPEHHCLHDPDGEGYRFHKAMKNPGFIGISDIRETYLPMGFSNFKIEGRGLGSALLLEFLLHYMTRPEYQLKVREMIYLENTLDLF